MALLFRTEFSSTTAHSVFRGGSLHSTMPITVTQNESAMSHENLYTTSERTVRTSFSGEKREKAKILKKKVTWAPALSMRQSRRESLNLSHLDFSGLAKDEPENSMSFSNVLNPLDIDDDDLALGESLRQRIANLTSQITDDEDSFVLLDGMPEFGQFFRPDFSRAASDNRFNRRLQLDTDLGSMGTLSIPADTSQCTNEQEEKATHLLQQGDMALTDERWNEALAWYKQAVRYQRDLFDPGDNRIHQTMVSVAECHANLGNPTLALSTLQDCLRVQMFAKGDNHDDVLLTKTYIAQLTEVPMKEDDDDDDDSEFGFSSLRLDGN